ncbi:MAG: DUF469 family protein [Gemmatimonadota bacterium]|nr:DUF469 family protein [Gemmatimonadota bacterium]
MTAACPTFGFIAVLLPRHDLSPDGRRAFGAAWAAFLQAEGLLASRQGGGGVEEYEVWREGSQTTERDREVTMAWLARRAELAEWRLSALSDLKETT